MTNLEAKQALARKLEIDYSDIANNDLFSAADLQYFINAGCRKAWSFKNWDFSEHSFTGTLTSTETTNTYVPLPNEFIAKSIFRLTLNGEKQKKLRFSSFSQYLEDYSGGDKNIWAEFDRKIFFNPNVASIGHVIKVWGKKRFTELSADGDLMPFSPDEDGEENGGNDACVQLAYAEALGSEKMKNPQQAQVETQNAFGLLNIIWDEESDGHAMEHTMNEPMFNVPDYFTTGRGRGTQVGKFSTN